MIKEWDYSLNVRKPEEYSRGSKEKVHWICSKCGYKWSAVINTRTKGVGCPACAGNIVVAGRNDLATKQPELLKEWDYNRNKDIVPNLVAVRSQHKYWWICPEDE